MLLESRGGLNQPAPSRSPQNTVKNPKIFFAFLKVHNEWGKVTKFGTFKPLFSWRNWRLKKSRLIQPPRPIRVKHDPNLPRNFDWYGLSRWKGVPILIMTLTDILLISHLWSGCAKFSVKQCKCWLMLQVDFVLLLSSGCCCVQNSFCVASDHVKSPTETCPVLGQVGRAVLVVGMGKKVTDVGVNGWK